MRIILILVMMLFAGCHGVTIRTQESDELVARFLIIDDLPDPADASKVLPANDPLALKVGAALLKYEGDEKSLPSWFPREGAWVEYVGPSDPSITKGRTIDASVVRLNKHIHFNCLNAPTFYLNRKQARNH